MNINDWMWSPTWAWKDLDEGLDMFRPLLIRCPRSQGPNAGVQRDGKTSVEGGEGGLEEVWTCNIFFLRLSDFAGFDVIL